MSKEESSLALTIGIVMIVIVLSLALTDTPFFSSGSPYPAPSPVAPVAVVSPTPTEEEPLEAKKKRERANRILGLPPETTNEERTAWVAAEQEKNRERTRPTRCQARGLPKTCAESDISRAFMVKELTDAGYPPPKGVDGCRLSLATALLRAGRGKLPGNVFSLSLEELKGLIEESPPRQLCGGEF